MKAKIARRLPQSDHFVPLTAALGILLAAFLLIPREQLDDVINYHLANSIVAAVILFQGIAVLRIVWNLEIRAGGGTLPFAWTLLAIQHLMFGFGGLLVALFDRDYYYSNAQGEFPWSHAALPFLFAHAVSLNVGLLGVAVATGRRTRSRFTLTDPECLSRWNVWSWDCTRSICYVSLAIHSVVWLFVIPIHNRLPAAIDYVAYGLAQTLNASYVLWGSSWAGCRGKKLFICYNAYFVMLSMLMGQRGEALIPLVLFGIGYLVSPAGQRWNWRMAIRWAPWAVPLLLFCFWISLASEDMRHNFTRGSLNGISDAMARLDSMLAGSNNQIYYAVGSGDDLNGPFRFGSRLFELSASDVISRTPGTIPFWGWSSDDTSVLLTGLLPLKLNSDAAYNTDPNAGVLFLQAYGWSYVDPTKGNSMPATLVADSWRRFGWPGVIVVFFCLLWALARVTMLLRSSPWGAKAAVFTSALLAYNLTDYGGELIYLVDSIPRRLVITAVYTVAVCAIASVLEQVDSRSPVRRRKIIVAQAPLTPAAR